MTAVPVSVATVLEKRLIRLPHVMHSYLNMSIPDDIGMLRQVVVYVCPARELGRVVYHRPGRDHQLQCNDAE